MKIYRRLFGKIESTSMRAELEAILKEDIGSIYFSKDFSEESDEYNLLKNYIEIYNLNDSVIGTEFTDEEILDAEILCFNGGKPFGYPQPEEPKYLENTYLNSCYTCGGFGDQKADFVVKKEPNLKLNSVATLHWVFGELFSETSLYEGFFKKMGLEKRAVIIKKGMAIAKSAVQVILPELETDLNMGDLSFSTCTTCGRVKYIPSTIGFFPRPGKMDFSITRTRAFFGSGHSADHRILVTNKVMKEMIDRKIAKKHQFVPSR